MRGPTLPFTSMKTYGPISVNLREKLKLLSLKSFSLSSHLISHTLPSPPFFFSFVCSTSISPFLIFLFSYLISFLIIFLFSSHFLLWFTLTRRDQVGETSPHLPSWPLVITIFILLFSFILFIASCNTWLNVSHIFQVYHMALAMCHSIGVSYGIT